MWFYPFFLLFAAYFRAARLDGIADCRIFPYLTGSHAVSAGSAWDAPFC